MQFIFKTTIMLLFFFIMGCTENKPKDEYKFIEYLKVEGICRENHVNETAEYKGSLVHWYNVTQDKHSRYGSVQNKLAFDSNYMFDEMKNPNKYHPPFSVYFIEITKEEFSKTEMELEGLSEYITGDETAPGQSYETTCKLKVIERLDHMPTEDDKPIKR